MNLENNTNQKSYLVKRIIKDKKELTKDVAKLSASALVVGLGSLGIVVFGNDLIKSFTSHNELTFSSYMHIRFQETLLAMPLTFLVIGVVFGVKAIKDCISSYKTLNQDNAELKSIEEKGKSR